MRRALVSLDSCWYLLFLVSFPPFAPFQFFLFFFHPLKTLIILPGLPFRETTSNCTEHSTKGACEWTAVCTMSKRLERSSWSSKEVCRTCSGDGDVRGCSALSCSYIGSSKHNRTRQLTRMTLLMCSSSM